jgi:hypothetical protein
VISKLGLSVFLCLLCNGAAVGATFGPAPVFQDGDAYDDQRSVSWAYRYCADPECNSTLSAGDSVTPDSLFAPLDAEVRDLADGLARQSSSLSPTAFHGAGEVSGSVGDSGLLPPPAAPIGGTLLVSDCLLFLSLDQSASAVISGHVDLTYSSAAPGVQVGYESAYASVQLIELIPDGNVTIVDAQVGSPLRGPKHLDFDVSVVLAPGNYSLWASSYVDLSAELSGFANTPASASWAVDWTVPEPSPSLLAGLALLAPLAARGRRRFVAIFLGTPRQS